MVHLYYIETIGVVSMYGGQKEQKGHKEEKRAYGVWWIAIFFDIWCEEKLLELLKPFKNRKWKDRVIDL